MSSTSASAVTTYAGSNQGVSTLPVQSSSVNIKDKDGKDATNANSKNSTAKKKKITTGAATAGATTVPTNSKVFFWQSECKYSVIIDRVKELDWNLVEGEKYESRVNLIWVDVSTIHEHFRFVTFQYFFLSILDQKYYFFKKYTTLANDKPLPGNAQYCSKKSNGTKLE
jgi:hypothetical protein